MWKGHRLSDTSNRSFSMPGMSFSDLDSDVDTGDDVFEQQPAKNGDEMWLPPAIPEEQEDTVDKHDVQPAEQTDAPGPSIIDNIFETPFDPMQHVPTLRKSASYESLLSVSGMDIHTLRERPSQLLGGFESRYFLPRRPPQRVVTVATETSSTPPVISTTNITADKASIVTTGSLPRSSHSLLASVAAKSSILAPNSDTASTGSNTPTTDPVPTYHSEGKKPATITRKVGGWVMGKWGIAPSSTTSGTPSSSFSTLTADILRHNQHHNLTRAQQSDAASISSDTTTTTSTSTTTNPTKTRPTTTTTPKPIIRGFGINQKGPIPGFVSSTPLPAKQVAVHAHVLDRELLDESLKE